MNQTKENFELFDDKASSFFDKALPTFWKNFLQLKQLFDAKLL